MKRSIAMQKGLPILGVFRFVKIWYIIMQLKNHFGTIFKLHGSELHSDPNISSKYIDQYIAYNHVTCSEISLPFCKTYGMLKYMQE